MYTHPKGKGAGKYNGMAKASDWEGRRVKAARQIRNGGGKGVTPGMTGRVTSAHRGLYVTFDVCAHCGTVMHVSQLDYGAVELAEE